ncbi:hypothetical protein V5O48_010644 [Marasmius crinis-equi]|uniref:Uncharacterized protein n=1 Tax=Marasmius crinis-equi TaxID=585013 RepID=A0ABR3F7S7_9AGAR
MAPLAEISRSLVECVAEPNVPDAALVLIRVAAGLALSAGSCLVYTWYRPRTIDELVDLRRSVEKSITDSNRLDNLVLGESEVRGLRDELLQIHLDIQKIKSGDREVHGSGLQPLSANFVSFHYRRVRSLNQCYNALLKLKFTVKASIQAAQDNAARQILLGEDA